MSYIITFSNQKGGVGKTTLTREIGVFLSQSGFRTLLIDTDPQANLSKGLTDASCRGTHFAFTVKNFEIQEIRDNLSLLHGSKELTQIERNLIGEVDAYVRLPNPA
jgi:chromosome partitioning protein